MRLFCVTNIDIFLYKKWPKINKAAAELMQFFYCNSSGSVCAIFFKKKTLLLHFRLQPNTGIDTHLFAITNIFQDVHAAQRSAGGTVGRQVNAKS